MPLSPYLYVPNIIGYVRVITGLASVYYAFDSPALAGGLYAFSYWLDAIDGVAARRLGQSTSPLPASLRRTRSRSRPDTRTPALLDWQLLALALCSTWSPTGARGPASYLSGQCSPPLRAWAAESGVGTLA